MSELKQNETPKRNTKKQTEDSRVAKTTKQKKLLRVLP